MFTKLSDVRKAVIFAVLAVALALVMVPFVTDRFITKIAYMWIPGIAVLVMLLIVTRDGYSREGWIEPRAPSVGLERLVDRLPGCSAHKPDRNRHSLANPWLRS
jgi:hypothetical protein